MSKRDTERLHDEIQELFADLWQLPRFAAGLRHGFRPAVDCYRTEEPPELTVVVEAPGINPESVQVVAQGRRLLVAGNRPRPRCDGQVYHRSEIDYGPFQRELVLNEDVEVNDATATYQRGMLKIVFPIAVQPPAPVRVSIEVRRP